MNVVKTKIVLLSFLAAVVTCRAQGIKISELPAVANSLNKTDVLPIVHDGATRKVTIGQIKGATQGGYGAYDTLNVTRADIAIMHLDTGNLTPGLPLTLDTNGIVISDTVCHCPVLGPAGNNGNIQYNWNGSFAANPFINIANIGGVPRIYVLDTLNRGLVRTNRLFLVGSDGNTADISVSPGGAPTIYMWPPQDGVAGEVLQTDGGGNLSWGTAGVGGWGLEGNAGTDPGSNFIGTNDGAGLTAVGSTINLKNSAFETVLNVDASHYSVTLGDVDGVSNATTAYLSDADKTLTVNDSLTLLNGKLAIVDGSQSEGAVFTSDADGNGTWMPKPYKSYIASIYKNPGDTLPPILTPLINELGANITALRYLSDGEYIIHADAPVFTIGKTLLHVEAASDEGDRIANYAGIPFTTTDIHFSNYDATGTAGSIYGLLHGAWIEIRVYP